MRGRTSVVLGVLVVSLGLAVPLFAQTPLETLQRLRTEYPAEMTPTTTAEMINRAAFIHRDEGYGLLRKDGGFRCEFGDIAIACDILIHRPSGRHFDVLGDAGGPSVPRWEDKGPCMKPPSGCSMDRFVAPTGVPGPGPIEPPPPQTDILAALQRIEATLARFEPKLDTAAHEAFNAAVRALQLQNDLPGKIDGVRTSLEEHRTETRKAWETVRKVLFEHITPIVAAILAGLKLGG